MGEELLAITDFQSVRLRAQDKSLVTISGREASPRRPGGDPLRRCTRRGQRGAMSPPEYLQILHVPARALLLRRPRIQGKAAALPYQEGFVAEKEKMSGRDGGLLRGLGTGGGFFAFDVRQPTLAFNVFVILLAHNSLLLSQLN
jgi:hypothetical protein